MITFLIVLNILKIILFTIIFIILFSSEPSFLIFLFYVGLTLLPIWMLIILFHQQNHDYEEDKFIGCGLLNIMTGDIFTGLMFILAHESSPRVIIEEIRIIEKEEPNNNFCIKCGRELDDELPYCPYCGYKK